ncbi:MAG: S1 RNA-binding domain-containing protein, partial [Chloroflexi bacterium]|nr:S1 RNA-binding domain-containing protein [Chloroflexota bacterium]
MIDQYLDLPTFQRGDIVEGVIVSVSSNEILVDIGGKTEGIIASREMERMDPAERESLHAGDAVMAYVVRPEGFDGHVVLSFVRAQMEKDWRLAEKTLQSEEVVRAKVVDANRGGLIVAFGELRGFVPASQLRRDRRERWRGQADGQSDIPWMDRVGREIEARVLEVDRRRNRLILSEQVVERARQMRRREELMGELNEGDVCQGVVRSLCDFGAFIDLGGVDGLLHI